MTDKTQNAYLLRSYGITLAERNAIMEFQGNRCACCGRPFDGKCRTEVDHEHFKVGVTYVEIIRTGTNCVDKHWEAQALVSGGGAPWVVAKTKAEAYKLATKAGLRYSVRGVLCGGRHAGCNRRLGKIDKPDWLRAVLAYLQNPPARQILN